MRVHPDLKEMGWNRRVLYFDDFEAYCQSKKILYLEDDIPWRGVYLVHRKRPVIAINRTLTGWTKLVTCWHELCHHLYDCPESLLFSSDLESKFERRANLIAHCAVIPKNHLFNPLFPGFLYDDDYTTEIIEKRKQIFYERRV